MGEKKYETATVGQKKKEGKAKVDEIGNGMGKGDKGQKSVEKDWGGFCLCPTIGSLLDKQFH